MDDSVGSRTVKTTFRTMGTLASVSCSYDTAPPGVDTGITLKARLQEECRRLELLLSRFIPDSDVSRICANRGDWVSISPETFEVLFAALRLSKRLDVFNIFMGVQASSWQQLGESGFPRASAAAGRLELRDGQARLDAPAGTIIDLGAIAKGYAADRLAQIALDAGATSVVSSLGTSSIRVSGRPVKIGVQSPWEGWETFGTLTISDRSLSVSADMGSKITRGRQGSHVLHPQTGAPALTDLVAVLVVGPDGMTCEAYSTAFLAMGLDDAIVLDQQTPQIDCLFMTLDGRFLASPNLDLTAMPGLQTWLRSQV
ncbi:FAD:protein FMN transferase [Propionimicrobium lymphophilum]|uniref:FAD:protein FMN transferase n=1 Tax=Propionimicrobium lymphophilum TaxID=33012 RepID=UPI000400B35D|nr:FAD:protein FMN transferase [Propionimicrobium lymphophilum]